MSFCKTCMPLRAVSEAKTFAAAIWDSATAVAIALFSRRSPCNSIMFSLKVVYLSRALIRVRSHGMLFPVGVVTTTANEKDAVCVHTAITKRKIPVCAVSAALKDVSPWLDKSSRYRVTRFFVCGRPYEQKSGPTKRQSDEYSH